MKSVHSVHSSTTVYSAAPLQCSPASVHGTRTCASADKGTTQNASADKGRSTGTSTQLIRAPHKTRPDPGFAYRLADVLENHGEVKARSKQGLPTRQPIKPLRKAVLK